MKYGNLGFAWEGLHPMQHGMQFKLPPQGTVPEVDVMYQPANEPQIEVVLKPVEA